MFAELYTENQDLRKAVKELSESKVKKANAMLQDEVSVLSQENHKLKDMVRDAEAKASPLIVRRTLAATNSGPGSGNSSPGSPRTSFISPDKDDNLMKMTKQFLDDLTSLELKDEQKKRNERKSKDEHRRNSSTDGENNNNDKDKMQAQNVTDNNSKLDGYENSQNDQSQNSNVPKLSVTDKTVTSGNRGSVSSLSSVSLSSAPQSPSSTIPRLSIDLEEQYV